jgi:hypothetical protein
MRQIIAFSIQTFKVEFAHEGINRTEFVSEIQPMREFGIMIKHASSADESVQRNTNFEMSVV